MNATVLRLLLLIVLLPSHAIAGECDPVGNERVLFCDEFDSPAVDHADSFQEVEIDGSTTVFETRFARWNSRQYVHGCEYQYYTQLGIDYTASGPENYAAPGHQSNFVLSAGDTLSLVLREESGTSGYIPTWKSQLGSCWMNWSLDNSQPPPSNNYQQTFNHTSGWLQGSPSFKYGKFEIRARIPNQGRVAWPAFWLFGGTAYDGNTSSYGENHTEIDVFEFTSYTPHLFTRNLHNYFSYTNWDSMYGDPADDPTLEDCNGGNWQTCDFTRDIAEDTMVLHDYYQKALSVNVGQWHTYTLEWTPSRIRWSLDGQAIGPDQRRDIPVNFMELKVNQALPDWLNHGFNNGVVNGYNTDLAFPSNFDIDYIKVSAIEQEHFTWDWGNGGDERIDLWFVNADDRHVTGDFDGDGMAELLSVNPTSKFAHVMDHAPVTLDRSGWPWLYTNADWSTSWLNVGNGWIDSWAIGPFDRFVAGDLVPDAAGKDDVLAINPNGGYAHLMEFNGSSWSTPFTNSGSFQFGLWFINADDHYVVGNFDGLPGDELLAIQEDSGHAHLMKYDGSAWQTIWTSNTGQIQTWYFHDEDSFVAGDFDDDGVDEVLAISASSQWAHLLSYDAASLTFVLEWTNWGSDWIALWGMGDPDAYVAGSFDGVPGDDLLAYNPQNDWSQLMNFQNGFHHIWGNGGFGRLHDPSHLLAGQFAPGSREQLLSITTDRWAYLQSFRKPATVFDFATGIMRLLAPSTWVFAGIAAGGSVDFKVEGVTLSVATPAGQGASVVTAMVAAAINADPTLSGLGVTASATGTLLNVNGVLSDKAINDSGLKFAQAPALSLPGQIAVVLLTLGAGTLALRRSSTAFDTTAG